MPVNQLFVAAPGVGGRDAVGQDPGHDPHTVIIAINEIE
jgi:hypothetical protein